jgi:hypothetical protein
MSSHGGRSFPCCQLARDSGRGADRPSLLTETVSAAKQRGRGTAEGVKSVNDGGAACQFRKISWSPLAVALYVVGVFKLMTLAFG